MKPVGRPPRPLLQRMWEKVNVLGPDECWPFIGARHPQGYGFIKRKDGAQLRAHRVALEERLGRELGEGMMACHTCDNPWCCNPAHLFEGTALDNTRDMIRKGRNAVCRGERNGAAKLTAAEVSRIRSDCRRLSAIAAEFGVSKSAIFLIKTGRRWAA